MIEKIERLLNLERSNITSWQHSFLESIKSQLTKNHNLSPRQLDIFEEIEEANSEKAISRIEEWKDSFDEEKREIFNVCVEYYKDAGYFSSIVAKSYHAEYIPSERDFKKLCENKYAARVIKSHFATPKYQKGEIVQFRKGRGGRKHLGRNIDAKYAAIIETDALPVKRAAKGSKVYRVLPVGHARMFYVLESDIKKARGLKK